MQLPLELFDIKNTIDGVLVDVRYATASNFTDQQLYIEPVVWLRKEPLEALMQASEDFEALGYSLVIFDAYRPPEVQDKLRTFCSNSDYVEEISNHCRGITVDITLADENGVYLDMGTEYDDFSEKSHPGTALINGNQTINRQTLAEVMVKHGFIQHPHEWWHFDYRPDQDWDLIRDNQNVYEFSKVL